MAAPSLPFLGSTGSQGGTLGGSATCHVVGSAGVTLCPGAGEEMAEGSQGYRVLAQRHPVGAHFLGLAAMGQDSPGGGPVQVGLGIGGPGWAPGRVQDGGWEESSVSGLGLAPVHR